MIFADYARVWHTDVSVYSLITLSRAAALRRRQHYTMTYYGAEKVVPLQRDGCGKSALSDGAIWRPTWAS